MEGWAVVEKGQLSVAQTRWAVSLAAQMAAPKGLALVGTSSW